MLEYNAATRLEEAARLDLLPSDEPRKALYEAALNNLDLPIVDYQLIRDLMCMADTKAEAALEAGMMALMVARQEGSLCLRLEAEAVARRLPDFEGKSSICREFVENIQSGRYDGKLAGHDDTDFRPLIASREHLYFQRALHDENTLCREYQARLQVQPVSDEVELERFRACIQQVLDAPPQGPSGELLALNREQQWALGLALLQRFCVVTGGPGTGKTSIVLALLRCLLRLGIPAERIALAAPTGRAAQRMTESLRVGMSKIANPSDEDKAIDDLEGQTLHRLLGYSPGRNGFTFDAKNPLRLDVLIVDEVSMIDATLMARLLEAVPATTRLVLLGDAHQLPSVEAGAVLADLVPPKSTPGYSAAMIETLRAVLPQQLSLPRTEDDGRAMTDHVVQLIKDYRSVRAIQNLAFHVNDYGDEVRDDLMECLLPGDNACRLDEDALAGRPFFAALKEWADRHYLGAYAESVKRCVLPVQAGVDQNPELREVLNQLGRARILTAVHEGVRGCVGINKFLAEYLRPRIDAGCREPYFVGTPIMVTCNDYALELYNGDTGIVLRDEEGGQRVAFARGDSAILVPANSLPAHVSAFAITVHKSQGSEFDRVLLVLPAQSESIRAQRLLSRQILYTAITRARKSVVINAHRDVLLQACRNNLQRDSGLHL